MTDLFKIIPITDTLQRPLSDLRISVTDRCNLRCTYCMPREVFDKNHVFLPRAELLSFEEIERLAKSFIGLGVQKIRLTGGEPLLRRNIEQLIAMLAKLSTPAGKPVEITLTTNAVLLSRQAQSLKDAGLARLSVSLDGLSDETFRRMSDSAVPVKTVLDGIAAAQRVGFAPVKVNMVVKRGVNDHEIIPMAEHFRNSGIVLRFIEYMDVGSTNGWRMDEVVTAREILERIAAHYPIRQVDPNYTGEVAERWGYADGGGEIGVIASITQAFCQTCTRARLSTDGKLYTCLFATHGADLRSPLREGATGPALTKLIADHWLQRNDRYSQLRQAATESGSTVAPSTKKIEMSYIGG
jgi:GTP 3',8-cyclase